MKKGQEMGKGGVLGPAAGSGREMSLSLPDRVAGGHSNSFNSWRNPPTVKGAPTLVEGLEES